MAASMSGWPRIIPWTGCIPAVGCSETQVREFLVAPLLIALGYREPQIETEFNIQSQFGGLRRPLRADYVVSVAPEYALPPNRLVVEVKRPSVSITSALNQRHERWITRLRRDHQPGQRPAPGAVGREVLLLKPAAIS